MGSLAVQQNSNYIKIHQISPSEFQKKYLENYVKKILLETKLKNRLDSRHYL